MARLERRSCVQINVAKGKQHLTCTGMWRELVFLFLPACRSKSSSSRRGTEKGSNLVTPRRPGVMWEMMGCCWGNSFHPPSSVLTGQGTVAHHKSVRDVCGDVFSVVLGLGRPGWVSEGSAPGWRPSQVRGIPHGSVQARLLATQKNSSHFSSDEDVLNQTACSLLRNHPGK